MNEEICRIKNEHVCEELRKHEERITELEKTYSIMSKMELRMGNVEEAVGRIDKKINEKAEEKGKKWDKLIDYLFYTVIAFLLGYIGLK